MSSKRHNDEYLDAARACILDVGWKRTTLTDVSRRAGVSRMTIYRAWPDMQTLLADLMTREWATVVTTVARTRDLADDSSVPWVDRIASGVTGAAAALRQNELFRRIVDVDPELMLPYLLDRRGRSQDAILELLAARIGEAQQAKHVRAGNPVLIARALLLMAHGFTLSAHTMTADDITEADLDAELHLAIRAALAA